MHIAQEVLLKDIELLEQAAEQTTTNAMRFKEIKESIRNIDIKEEITGVSVQPVAMTLCSMEGESLGEAPHYFNKVGAKLDGKVVLDRLFYISDDVDDINPQNLREFINMHYNQYWNNQSNDIKDFKTDFNFKGYSK